MPYLNSNISRRMIGGSVNSPTQEIRHTQTSGQQPLLQRAVVIEVFDNPSALTEEEKQLLAERVNNPEYVDILPVNSVLARIVNDGVDLGNPTSVILFPFFSSNIQLPIVPGEHVHVVYDDPSRSGTVIGYWLSRVSEQRTVEDVNYSVADRRYDHIYNPQMLSTTERSDENTYTPEFPNGGNTPSTYTLRISGSNNQNPYDGIVQESKSIRNFTFEPVPRFNKRPGELVIQGRNNSLIVLGEDRIGPVARADSDAIGQAGSIDLVVGRGRILPKSANEDPEGNAPRIIENSRSQYETDKAPYLTDNRQDNPNEGDPDFAQDAARILVSMQTEADNNFNIVDMPYPTNVLTPTQPKEGSQGTLGKSYVLAKADNIRLIGRKDDNVDGTVLILREASEEEDLAYFYINDKGKIQIYSSEIHLGESTQKEEPYIKYSEYKKSVEGLQNQIDTLKSSFDNLYLILQTSFSTAIAVPNSPVTALTQAVPNLVNENVSLTSNIEQAKQETSNAVTNAKSTVIFGS